MPQMGNKTAKSEELASAHTGAQRAGARLPRLMTDGELVRETILSARAAGQTVGLVPTMGALHQGHLSLVDASRAECDMTVVTVFVNPTQFGPNEDFRRYPRDLERDRLLLSECGCDLVFAPT